MNKICKYITIAIIVAFIISLIPVIGLTVVNHSTGDDLNYSIALHDYLNGRGDYTSAVDAISTTLRNSYRTWQGTWFSIILFALQPGVFGEQYYVIVTPMIALLWFGSTYYLFYYVFVKRLKAVDVWGYLGITTLFLILTYEFIPSTRSSLFWYNGIAHYMIPFSMCQFMIVWILQMAEALAKEDTKPSKTDWLRFVGICIMMSLLGGSSYHNALLIGLICTYVLVIELVNRHRRALFLLIPMILEGIGLLISMTAPGNKVRGGSEFGLSMSRVVQTIGMSFVEEGRDIYDYVLCNPILAFGLIILIALTVVYIQNEPNAPCFVRSHPIISIILLWMTCLAMEAPEIYAGVNVSGGVYNMVYQSIIFGLYGTALIILLSLHNRGREVVWYIVIGICLIVMFLNKGIIKKSTTYISYDYIVSGQAADYKRQMIEQDMLLTSGEMHVQLHPINDQQGPLMHMPVVNNPKAFTNEITRFYYGVESVEVIGLPD